jgi:hypothetical protein
MSQTDGFGIWRIGELGICLGFRYWDLGFNIEEMESLRCPLDILH